MCIDSPDDPETRKKVFAAAPGCPNLLKGTEVVHFSAPKNVMAKPWLSRQASKSYGRSEDAQM